MYALDGINVLSVENGVSAPLCTRFLGDFGADVVKVERPNVGDVNRSWDSAINGRSSTHVWVDRNKQSLELDLKSDEGRQIFLELAEEADVVVQNFSSGTVEDLGIGYETVSAVNKDVVYLNISGYGDEGPYETRKAYDLIMQGETGLISMTGTPDAPAKIPISICDINAGMYGLVGTLLALFHRSTTGSGQEIDVDMFSGTLSWLGVFPLKYWFQDAVPERVGMRHHVMTPYGPFECGDGEYVNVAVVSDAHWQRFCTSVIKEPDLLEDDRFTSNEGRLQHRDDLEPRIEDALKSEPADHWIEQLEAENIPWGRVNDIEDAVTHPQVQAQDLVETLETEDGEIPVIGNPVTLSEVETRCTPMPELGADSRRILANLGYSDEEIDALKQANIV